MLTSCQKFESSDREISIVHLKLMYEGYPILIKDNIIISGQVVADNSTPNFNGSVIIQDDTGAIEISVADSYLASYINIGDMVEVRCQGLCLGAYGGVVELGLESEDMTYQISMIPQQQINRYINILDEESSDDIKVEQVLISELAPSMISTMVEIKNLEVIAADSQILWTTSVDDIVNTLAVDSVGDTITLRVYGYCDFAADLLPSYPINARGCLGYFNGYQLRLLAYSY